MKNYKRGFVGSGRIAPTIIGVAVVLLAVTPEWSSASPKDRIGEQLEDVTLRTLDGEAVQLLDYHTDKVLVVAYTGVGCPISQRYASVLESLSKRYHKKGVRFVGINANPQDGAETIAKEMRDLGLTIPVLKDEKQALTHQLGAKTTTVAFVVDRDRKIRYRGMIDDQYALGTQRSKPKNRYLEMALKAMLKGEDVDPARTAAPGCRISLSRPTESKTEEVTYSSHIAGIIQANCQNCHRKGQIGPFPLTSYERVRGWSAMIHSVIEDGRMPPWNAHPDHDGVFVNQRKLSARDKDLLTIWIDNGMPRGNPEDDPPEKTWPKGWRIGKPDKVYSMRASYSVPKDGPIEYQYFTVRTRFKKDKWVKAVEARPGAPEVVHHIVVFVEDRDAPPLDRRAIGLRGFLAATVPGDTPSIFPEGAAKLLPAGAKLIFQVHYTPNGKRYKDKCSVGLIFADAPVEHEVKMQSIYDFSFKIPAGAPYHEVKASHTFDEEIVLLSLFPHMHYRGKDWTFVAYLPDGTEKRLLGVPRYDFNWQESYILKDPLVLPAGTRIECVAHFDNSSANFANPDPTVAVRFGEQTWEEMMIGYVEYYVR